MRTIFEPIHPMAVTELPRVTTKEGYRVELINNFDNYYTLTATTAIETVMNDYEKFILSLGEQPTILRQFLDEIMDGAEVLRVVKTLNEKNVRLEIEIEKPKYGNKYVIEYANENPYFFEDVAIEDSKGRKARLHMTVLKEWHYSNLSDHLDKRRFINEANTLLSYLYEILYRWKEAGMKHAYMVVEDRIISIKA